MQMSCAGDVEEFLNFIDTSSVDGKDNFGTYVRSFAVEAAVREWGEFVTQPSHSIGMRLPIFIIRIY